MLNKNQAVNQNLLLTEMLLIDIETVPSYNSFESLRDEIKLLWVDKISKTMPEISPEESYSLRAGILAEFGKIICISIGFYHEDENGILCLRVKSICCEDESDLLHKFIKIADSFLHLNKRIVFGGHNIKEFDIPFICRRMLINNIALPAYLQLNGLKPWETEMADTMQWWKFGDYKNYISLNLLACVLGVPTSKGDMDGSQVQHVYYNENDLKRIVTYCEKDVIAVANIILRFRNKPILYDVNIKVAEREN